MNNLLSYCGLTDAKMRASEKDLPVYSLYSSVMAVFAYKFNNTYKIFLVRVFINSRMFLITSATQENQKQPCFRLKLVYVVPKIPLDPTKEREPNTIYLPSSRELIHTT